MAEVVKTPKICDLCCHESTAWAVGECDHPLCLRCTAKMRVLCDQRECPVCRYKIDMVLVSSQVKPFSATSLSRLHGDRKYGIFFENRHLAEQYQTLRESSCTKCNPKAVFRNFKQLRDHMTKIHDLHYCDICVGNLKLFPGEFKAYTRPMLIKHRREGDSDDSSHKGHPMCRFCDDRHLDNDTLHSHLRTEHFWCHICENDGKQDYYKNYPLLRKHFKEEHYLCEEGPCREKKFTSVFRSKIDLQAHRASTHTKGLSKAEVRQMKQLELGFSYGGGRGEGGAGPRSRGGAYVNPRNGRTAQMRERELLEVATAQSASLQPPEPKRKPKKQSSPPPQGKNLPSPEESKPSPPRPKKTSQSPEETKPPPGFAHVAPKLTGQQEVVHESSVAAEGGFDPYSKVGTESNTTVSKPPPGFENVTVPEKTTKKEESEWPKIVSKGSDIEAVKSDKQSLTENELAGLQPPVFVTGSRAKRTVKSENPEQNTAKKKSRSKPEVPPDTSEEFPPMLPSGVQSRPPSQDKAIKNEQKPTTRKQLESKVVERIQEILNKDKAKYTQFKTLSGWYRNSEIAAVEYMSQCSELFGPKWEEIGPKVAGTFPEEAKKYELLSFFSRKPPRSANQPKSKKKSTVWTSQYRPPARSALSDADYPSLKSASSLPGAKVTGTGAWNMVVRT